VTGFRLPREVHLARRQADVLDELLADGASNAAIGKRLYLSEDTVKTHLRTIMAKAGVGNRTELVVAVLREKITVVRQ
jgi:DNA-binding NarL/FixJ family response regulator